MRRGVFALVLLMALGVPASAWGGRPITSECQTVFCGGLSSDGSRVIFPFGEELTSGAGQRQIYEKTGETLRPLIPHRAGAPGPAPASLDDVSADATHVFVSTNAALAAEDTDGGGTDVYDISAGAATLISTGPLAAGGGPNAASPMSFAGASPDGARVFFNAFGSVVPEDADNCPDLYERFNGQSRLVATGPTARVNTPPPLCDFASFGLVSADGSHLFFTTSDNLIPEDEGGDDIYQRVGDSLTLLTPYPDRVGNCVETPRFADASADGATILFTTNASLSAADTDSGADVYKRLPDGSFVLVSRGTDPGAGYCGGFLEDRPVALSADGHTAIFETRSRLSPEDTDSSNDLYSADDSGAISLVTTGPTDPNLDEHSAVFPDWLADVSDDASHIAFESRQSFVVADKDTSADVYLRANGQTELASTGPLSKNANGNAELLAISGDGQAVIFATKERLTSRDTDDHKDVYLHRAGQARTVLVSAEAIAPQMRISPRGALLGSAAIELRLGCPKAETSGPCHGKVSLSRGRHGKRIGGATFRIAPGRGQPVHVHLRRSLPVDGPKVVFARVRGIDRLGNSAIAVSRLALAVR